MNGCFHWLERKGRMSKTNLTKKENFYREYDGHDEYRLIIDVVDLDECCDIDPIGLCTPEDCMSCKNARIKLIRTDGVNMREDADFNISYEQKKHRKYAKYKSNPVYYMEEIFGVKFSLWQKKLFLKFLKMKD